MYANLKNGMHSAINNFQKIESVGIDTWGIDFAFIDRNGKLISNPGSYRDEKRWNITNELYEVIPKKELYFKTGAITIPVASIYHFFYLKKTKATELINAWKFLMMTDIFNYFLTGEIFNEFTSTTITLMYDQKKRDWDNDILNKLEIPSNIFPKTLMPGTQIGNIQKSVCKEMGISPFLVVAPCTHDTPGAIAGIPVVKEKRNWAFVPIGTWSVTGIETEDLIISEEGMDQGYYNEGGVDGINIFTKNITALWLIQQCRKKWLNEIKNNLTWDDIDNMALTATELKSFINVDDPLFSQPQADMPRIISQYCKDNGQEFPVNPAEVARCVLESLAFRIKYDLEILELLTDKKIEIIYIIGGGVRNKVLCQFISDATGLPVTAGPAESSTAGNLLMQLKATGEIKSLEEGRQLSLNSSEIFYYEPKNKNKWDYKYKDYLKVIKKNM
jgi:sugar (pentulose or hexulose) kinase